MFDLFISILNTIEFFYTGFISSLVDAAEELLANTPIKSHWDDLIANETLRFAILDYAPLADRLINWEVIKTMLQAEFALLVAILKFKIGVKLIPSIW